MFAILSEDSQVLAVSLSEILFIRVPGPGLAQPQGDVQDPQTESDRRPRQEGEEQEPGNQSGFTPQIGSLPQAFLG